MSKARIFMVAAAAMTLFLVCGTAVFLHGQKEYVPPNQVSRVNVERSQMFLTGTGYTLDKEQEKSHNKTEKQREKQQKENPKQVKPASPQKTAVDLPVRRAGSGRVTGGNSGRTGPARGKPSGTEGSSQKPGGTQTEATKPSTAQQKPTSTEPVEDKAKKPVIRLSIANGEEIRGKRLDFTVSVTDYRGRNIPVFSESDGSFRVACNGSSLFSTGADERKTTFRTDLREGQNQIVVTATDREGHVSTKTVGFTGIIADAEKIGVIEVRISAEVVNLGVLFDDTIEIIPGDTAKDVLETAFQQAGITPSFSGDYLAGISGPGISEGAYVSDDLRDLMEERGVTEKDPDKQDRSQLKEHDFYSTSGWKYAVNGDAPKSTGLGSYRMENGDVLDLFFVLADDVYILN